VLQQNLERSGLCQHHSVIRGLIGARRSGSDDLWLCSKNFLSASLQPATGTYSVKADYLDLDAIIGSRQVDLLKVDIEGAEYDLVETYPAMLSRVCRVMMEIHEQPGRAPQSIYKALGQVGLQLRVPPLRHGAAILAMFERR
jgi:FkbM family methyltransferase